ncbi:MAG: hypothetical protein KIS86_04625 [Devosia sp.]|nr:hypothetical protein [Devosia sp.]
MLMAHRSWKIKAPAEHVQRVAAAVVPDHADRMARGFRLMASSGLWRTKNAGVTGRFVYRLASTSGEFVVTVTMRGLPL